MVEEDVKDFRLKYCNYCAWNIPDELIENILKNNENDFFCERCGVDLMKENQDFQEIAKKRAHEIGNESDVPISEKKTSRIPKYKNKLKRLKTPREEKIDVVYGDQEFPKLFIENIVIVLARMIYLVVEDMKEFSSNENIQMKPPELLVNEIMVDLSPVTEDRIKQEFLRNLTRISKKDFEFWLKKLQAKVQADQFYYVCFIEFLRDLIADVLEMVFEKWERQDLSAFEKTIINDLRNFDFKCMNENQKREEVIDLKKGNNNNLENFSLTQENQVKNRFITNDRGEVNAQLNSNELILIHDDNSGAFNLTELCNAYINDQSYTFGLNEDGQLEQIKIEQLEKFPRDKSYYIVCKHGSLALSEQHYLFTVDDDLNMIKVPVSNVKIGMPILMPRVIDVAEDNSPLDFSNCGDVIEENGIQYVQHARTKAFRFVEKNFEVGYILGQYCAEGYMRTVSISCGNDENEMEEVADFVERNFGFIPSIYKHNKEGYKAVYSVDSGAILIKNIFTKGLGLKIKKAPFKEIPPFLYNAPIECGKGFLAGFMKGDGSIEDRIREDSPSRDIDVRLHTSSRNLVFGLNFLLKRLGIDSSISKREFDDIEHPSWYDTYTIRIKGKRNMDILRTCISNIPKYGKYARGQAPSIDLNPWIKTLNAELKEKYNKSLRMLVERKYIPFMVAKCAQENNKKNLSEDNLLKTLSFLKKNGYITPLSEKLSNIFEKHTFTKVKAIEVYNKPHNIYNLSILCSGIYIAGIGQIYIK